VYNGQAHLAETLDALLAQTYERLEIVICDNASTDGTAEIARQYCARDGRVRYVRNRVNIGVLPNYRRVLELASSDYFTWTAADDVRPPHAIAALMAALQGHPDAPMAYGPVQLRVDEAIRMEVSNEMHQRGLGAAGRVRQFTRAIKHNAMLYGLYRRAAAQQIGLGPHYGVDYLACLTMCLLGPLAYTPTPMLVYRHKTGPATSFVNPMYGSTPLTLRELFTMGGIRRKKCWSVLLVGSRYLARAQPASLDDRVAAIAAHVVSFAGRYWRSLAREAAILTVGAVQWLLALPWRIGRRSRLSWSAR
jgi:glycosyltransferase involved in cell wall biosynthesis